jgi:hypothetical protein
MSSVMSWSTGMNVGLPASGRAGVVEAATGLCLGINQVNGGEQGLGGPLRTLGNSIGPSAGEALIRRPSKISDGTHILDEAFLLVLGNLCGVANVVPLLQTLVNPNRKKVAVARNTRPGM